MPKRSFLQIDKNKIRDNYKHLEEYLKNTKMICVVKSDAYGHDATMEAHILEECGATFFAVACVQEAIELRKQRISGDILVFSHTLREDMDALQTYDLIQTIGDIEYGKQLITYAKEKHIQIRVHFKVDTGMHRLGITKDTPIDKLLELYKAEELRVEGIYSHLVAADSFEKEDIAFTHQQKKSFDEWLIKTKEAGMKFTCTHLLASAAILNYEEYISAYSHLRPGILFLGFDSGEMKYPYVREEISSWHSYVEKVDILKEKETIGYGRNYQAQKEIKVATLLVGYGDGLPRRYQDKGEVLIGGKRCPFVGRISMDQCCVDVSALDDVKIGDEVILIGRQGKEYISWQEMASKTSTIPNEIVTQLTKRLPRIYVD